MYKKDVERCWVPLSGLWSPLFFSWGLPLGCLRGGVVVFRASAWVAVVGFPLPACGLSACGLGDVARL